MSIPLTFKHGGKIVEISLQRTSNPKEKAVTIEGRDYKLLGSKEAIALVTSQLQSTSFESFYTFKVSLSQIKPQKPTDVFNKTIGAVEKAEVQKPTAVGKWKKSEESDLPQMKKIVARMLWDTKDKRDLSGLKQILGEEKFEEALLTNNFDMFLALFDTLSADRLWDIRNNENCQPLGFVKTEPYTLTPEDIQNLKEYLRDIGFSGAVQISDAKGSYCISPNEKDDLKDVPFCMHSIGKMYTGTLALLTLPELAFHDKLPLDLSGVSALPEPVQKHLSKPTLLQTMNHRGGFGDYLGNYQKAIKDALEKGEEPPVINKIEDFLKYADNKLYPLNEPHYSNLAILLLALRIQHHCKMPFDQILKDRILKEANTKVSSTKPPQARFSPEDPCKGETIGGPAGGDWTTVENLHHFGTWLSDKCKTDPDFMHRIEQYGTEFYVPEDKEIHHNGNSSSGSALLSSFLQSGVTISILSDQSNFMADRVFYTIRENLIEKSS